jgi:hypothetical protein
MEKRDLWTLQNMTQCHIVNRQVPHPPLVVLKDFARQDIAIGLNHQFAKAGAAWNLIPRHNPIKW